MSDVHTKEQRSRNMAAIRNKGNKSTEGAILQLLKTNKVTGWRRNYKQVEGTPDFAFSEQKIAVFVDGCFWHGCPKCATKPKSNIKFWENKIANNKKRDRKVTRQLRQKGWSVIRIKEHQLKNNTNSVMSRINKSIQ